MDDTSVDTESTNPPSGEEERSRPFDADAGADEPIGPNNNGDRADNEEVAKAHCRPDVPNYWYDANPDPDEYLSRDDDVVRTSRWSFSAWVPAGDAIFIKIHLLWRATAPSMSRIVAHKIIFLRGHSLSFFIGRRRDGLNKIFLIIK